MKFTKGKHTEWWIMKFMDGQWQLWEERSSEKKAWILLDRLYDGHEGKNDFKVVKVEMTMWKKSSR
ncbi:MAG: hypothetical protein A2Z21_01910 [Candidatus Fraserbacteria bacterium RBG_16_55_9]|uniref:Uncharacterized protein n=1 Tax=Fraserbacteria sp. (strain RBG_16_55_9) TaxID=1817864 RepID=A0A1F5UP60_FRAXR|nr:MAG: hypothetical protein A2Z21_01910 [Candidatus Fraserbacteria bacterium RBG_16_55_9]